MDFFECREVVKQIRQTKDVDEATRYLFCEVMGNPFPGDDAPQSSPEPAAEAEPVLSEEVEEEGA